MNGSQKTALLKGKTVSNIANSRQKLLSTLTDPVLEFNSLQLPISLRDLIG